MSIRIDAMTSRLDGLAPQRGQPWLLRSRHSRRPIVMSDLGEFGCIHEFTPLFEIVIGPIAFAIPAFLIITPWIGAEEHALGFQRVPQLLQNTWQFLTGDTIEIGRAHV